MCYPLCLLFLGMPPAMVVTAARLEELGALRLCSAMALLKRSGSMMTPASLRIAGRVRFRKDTSAWGRRVAG